jgi:plastocyanin
VRRLLIAAVALGALAVAGQASAASWKVFAGEQARPPAGVPKQATLDAFFPSRLTINAGDSVTFSSASFHTVTYTGGARPPAIFVRDPAKATYPELKDAARMPFYFSGLPKLIYNGPAFAPSGPKTIQGKTPASSGVLTPGPSGRPVSATFQFPRPGSYKLLCTIHPGMKATIAVKPGGSSVPVPPATAEAEALTAIGAAWQKIKQEDAAARPPANTVFMGIGREATTLAFYPKVLRIKAGTTVTFVTKAPEEVHDVAFGPKKYLLQFSRQTDLLPAGPGKPNQLTPVYVYGTEPKGRYVYDGANHGNGFLVTPLADGVAGGLPNASRVTFTKAGRYHYICFLHGPDMSGDVVVTP